MKKFFIGLLVVVGLAAVVGFLFKEPLMNALIEQMTSDMFIAADTDDFDPGLAIDQPFPTINATTSGRTVTNVAEFAGANGLVFIANRSIDW